jgi:hypothetical protein
MAALELFMSNHTWSERESDKRPRRNALLGTCGKRIAALNWAGKAYDNEAFVLHRRIAGGA